MAKKNNSFFNVWGYDEHNGFIGYVHTAGCCDGISMTEVTNVVNNIVEERLKDLDIEEIDDKLYVNSKEVMVDDYVKSGKYNGDGTATLQIGEDKTSTIEDLPKPMSSAEVDEILGE